MAGSSVSSAATTSILSNVENWCCTNSKIVKFNFVWTIDNFHFLKHKKPGEMLKSSFFSPGSDHESKWYLKFYPKGLNGESKEFVSVFLNLESLPSKSKQILGAYTVSILNSKGIQQKMHSCDVHSFVFNQDWGYSKFVSLQYILDKSNDVLPDDKLTIFCEIEILSDPVNTSGKKIIDKFEMPDCKLSNDLSNLLKSKKFSDVTLVVGNQEFAAHKTILAARSDVFSAMFEHEMKESKLNRVHITDIDKDVVPEMLHFIYTGQAPNINKMLHPLFAAADKYALEELKLLCEEALFSGMSIETAAETLILADRHSADRLKENVINFFKTHAKEIIKTNEWKFFAINNPNLLSEVFEALVTSKDKLQDRKDGNAEITKS